METTIYYAQRCNKKFFSHNWLYKQKKQSDLSQIFSKAHDMASHKISEVGNKRGQCKNLYKWKKAD